MQTPPSLPASLPSFSVRSPVPSFCPFSHFVFTFLFQLLHFSVAASLILGCLSPQVPLTIPLLPAQIHSVPGACCPRCPPPSPLQPGGGLSAELPAKAPPLGGSPTTRGPLPLPPNSPGSPSEARARSEQRAPDARSAGAGKPGFLPGPPPAFPRPGPSLSGRRRASRSRLQPPRLPSRGEPAGASPSPRPHLGPGRAAAAPGSLRTAGRRSRRYIPTWASRRPCSRAR